MTGILDFPTSGGSLTNIDAAKLLAALAQQAATQKYLNKRLELEKDQFRYMRALDKDKLALQEASDEFDRTYKKAVTMGFWGGNKNKPTWQKIVQEAGLTGYYGGDPTLQREQFEVGALQNYLGLIGQLRGPRNAFQMLKVLQGTPGGMRDLLQGAAGYINIPGYGGGDATVGTQPATLGNLSQDAFTGQMGGYSGGDMTGANWSALPMYETPRPNRGTSPPPEPEPSAWSTMPQGNRGTATVSPPGVQAPMNWYNYEPNGSGGYNIYPPGNQAPANNGQYSTPVPASSNEASTNANVGGYSTLPLPNQWNARNIGNYGAYQKDMLLAGYEAAGWEPQAAWDTYTGSLPEYGGPARGSISVM